MKRISIFAAFLVIAGLSQATLIGSLSTADGLESGGQTWSLAGTDADDEGLRVDWAVWQNPDGTWHYQYTFSNEENEPLMMDVSHFIISISSNVIWEDIMNLSGGELESPGEVDTFEDGVSNPGFPNDQSLYGLKINLGGSQVIAEFDIDRSPMWGDFYAKGGGQPKNYAYNVDFGVPVANLTDYTAPAALDADGNSLYKILVPDTVPEPTTLTILGIGAIGLLRFRRV